MPVWQVVLLLNLTLAVGLGFGYGVWGHRLAALDGELKTVQAQVERLERERQACAAGARVGEQQWEGRGIVRAVYPQPIPDHARGDRWPTPREDHRLSRGRFRQ